MIKTEDDYMPESGAYFILFQDKYNSEPLFKNPGDLASALINTTGSAFYTSKVNQKTYNREFNRIRAYISQLLSDQTRRNVTDDFIMSLQLLIEQRLPKDSYDTAGITNRIIADLKNSNSPKDKKQQVSRVILTSEDFHSFRDQINLWIKKVMDDVGEPGINNDYKKGQVQGIEDGALLMFGLIQQRLRGHEQNGANDTSKE